MSKLSKWSINLRAKPKRRKLLQQDAHRLGMDAYNKGDSMDNNPYCSALEIEWWREWNEGFYFRLDQSLESE